jgi:3-oxoacyl-[acyl-carrier protein] reductase
MESLSTELAPFGIRVNLLVPGHYPTRLTAGITETQEQNLKGEIPLRRFGKPEELGPAAVLLLSDKLSAYTTGSQLVVDGGLHLRPLRFNSDEELRALNEP